MPEPILQYCQNWQDLTNADKRELSDFFELHHPQGWNWRRFAITEEGADMEIEFIDPQLAVLFKLRWGGK